MQWNLKAYLIFIKLLKIKNGFMSNESKCSVIGMTKKDISGYFGLLNRNMEERYPGLI